MIIGINYNYSPHKRDRYKHGTAELKYNKILIFNKKHNILFVSWFCPRNEEHVTPDR
jgi:hypothetical protein